MGRGSRGTCEVTDRRRPVMWAVLWGARPAAFACERARGELLWDLY
jgi:hypothetical protein